MPSQSKKKNPYRIRRKGLTADERTAMAAASPMGKDEIIIRPGHPFYRHRSDSYYRRIRDTYLDRVTNQWMLAENCNAVRPWW